jgi:fatty-acyl-CoA synthase
MTAVRAGVMAMLEQVAAGPHADHGLTFEGRHVRYDALRDRAYGIAHGLQQQGVKKGDRVAVLLRNGVEWFELCFALADLGAVCAPVNVLLAPGEIRHLCEDADATAIVVDAHGAAAAEKAGIAPALVVGVGGAAPAIPGARHVAYEDLDTGARASTGTEIALDDLFVLYYSSGTTGLPKGAVHSHGSVLWNAFHQVGDIGLTADDTYLIVPSLSWAAGFHVLTMAELYVGARLVLMPTGGITMRGLADAAHATGATRGMIVPTLLQELVRDPEIQERVRTSPLRWMITGTQPVPKDMILAIQEALPDLALIQGYGMSEFPTIATVLRDDEAVRKAGSAGRATSVTRVAVELEDGTVADVGEGEILTRSPATMAGYWNRPEETAAAFAGGWFHTGDVGRLDEEGFLTITGRKKDMIISGGLNVYPSETEAVIHRMDGVLEVAVVGYPDARLGEVPVAVVVGEGLDPDAIAAGCREDLATYKVPRHVIVRDAGLPRNANGKILKRELRPWVAEELSPPPRG